eukprot:COSAG01_NODE_44469_length_418_cov_54.758621_1_plen_70_part_10
MAECNGDPRCFGEAFGGLREASWGLASCCGTVCRYTVATCSLSSAGDARRAAGRVADSCVKEHRAHILRE